MLIIQQALQVPNRRWSGSPAVPSPAPRRTLYQPRRRMQAPGQHPKDTPTTARWMRRYRERYVGIAGWRPDDPWRRSCRLNHGSALPEWGGMVQSRPRAVKGNLCKIRRDARQTTTRTTSASCSGVLWQRKWWECWRTFEQVLAVCRLGEDVAHANTLNTTRQLCLCLCGSMFSALVQ